MNVRKETAADVWHVRSVVRAAFEEMHEANLVDLLRKNGKLVISLIAEEGGEIIGYIAFSEVVTDPFSAGCRIAGLAPVAVITERQKRGIGFALINLGPEQARPLGYTHVVVFGEPE